MRITKRNKKIWGYCFAFCIPCLLLVSVWIILGLAPFGNNNLMVSDFGTQYVPFLNALKRFFLDGGQCLYSFENGIGGPMESTIAYYLMSPFNLFVLLFSYEKIPEVVLAIITLKIALMGLSMYTYLDRHYKQSNLVTQAFSLAYSFCGFVIVYLLNFMWLDVLVLLPILVLGLERVWYEKKYGLYAIVLFLSILTNYYLGYMVCIFAVLYSIFIYYLAYERSPANSFKQFFDRWRGFLFVSLMSGLLTSFMLVPAILGMFQTGKANFHLRDFLPVPSFGLEIFSQMGIGTINYSLRLYHLPMIYTGIFVYLLCVLYFSLPIVPKRKKKAMVAFLIIMIVSFSFNLPNTIWHMFQSPAGFPYRNTFILSFLLIKVAYEAYLYSLLTFDTKIIKQRLVVSGVLFSVLLSLGQLFLITASNESFLLSNRYFLISLVIIWVMVFLVDLILTRKSMSICLVFIVFVSLEMGGNLFISMKDIPFGNQSEYETTYCEQKKIIDNLTTGRDDLFRIKQGINTKQMGYNEINNGYNNSFLFGYSGVSSYSSTLNSTVQKTLVDLGVYEKNERRFSYVDESQVINLLLNVPYRVTPKESSDKKKVKQESNTFIYQNMEAIGSGFLTNQRFREVTLKPGDVLNNQETILQSLLPLTNTTYFNDMTDVQVKQDKNLYQIKGVTLTEGINYFYLPYAVWNNVKKLTVNGKEISTDIYITTNQLYNFGYFEKNQEVTVEIEVKDRFDVSSVSWASLDQTKFDELIAYQKSQAIDLKKTKFGSLRTSVQVREDHQLLYLSIPYDKNWQVSVNGQKMVPEQIIGDFMGIELDAGDYDITLKYVSLPLIVGSALSFLTLIIIVFLSINRRKKRKKNDII